MSEVRLPAPVRAIPLDEDGFWSRRVPGSFYVEPTGGGEQWFWFRCPCGCGQHYGILAGDGFKPTTSPSWQWNGSLAGATLHPSVWNRGHWHGWLRNGEWVQA